MTTYQVRFIDLTYGYRNMQLSECEAKRVQEGEKTGETIVLSCERVGVIR